MDANSLDAPMPFDFEGKTYMVAPRSVDQELAFQRHLESEELQAIRSKADVFTVAEYDRAMDRYVKTCALRKYAWGGTLAWEAVNSKAGVKYLYALAVAEGSGLVLQVALELLDKVFEDDAAWKALQAVMQVLNDPNRKRPTQTVQASAGNTE